MPRQYAPLQREILYPLGGVSENLAYSKQEEGGRDTQPTCVDALNARGHDPRTGRFRGAGRAGHSKYVASQLNGATQFQCITHSVAYSAHGSLSSAANRTIKPVAVAGGTVKSFTSSGFGSTTNGSAALSSTAPYIGSAELFGTVYFADGANYKLWTASTDTVSAWTASAGTLPANGANKPRLCAVWRARMVLSGVIGDDHNWFMSRNGDPTDFDYAPGTTDDESQAVAGNNAPAGKCADAVRSIIPYNDDLLIFGCDHSIWRMTNDPMAGGRLDLVSDVTGMAFGEPWCKDPNGLIYFFGSRGGLYVMSPESLPVRISSNRIEERLATVDLTKVLPRLAWDDRTQHVMLYLTDLSGAASTHYAIDARNKAFWPDQFETANHNPTAVHTFDGDQVADRVVLLGCRDGYMRYIDYDSVTDDGEEIESRVWLGPLEINGKQRFRVDELQAVLSSDSGVIRFQVYDGASPEQAVNADRPRFEGVWGAGRNKAERRRAAGSAVYVKLLNCSANASWALESLVASMKPEGRMSSRAF